MTETSFVHWEFMTEFWVEVAEAVLRIDVLIRVLEIVLGLFGFAGLAALSECRRTTKRLKKYVKSYMQSAGFEWTNQTDEFVVAHRVRAFEILSRNIQVLQPRTPWASNRVEDVRDALESLHSAITIFRGEHLPLPRLGAFPLPPNQATEAHVRERIVERLRAIKWPRLEKSTER